MVGFDASGDIFKRFELPSAFRPADLAAPNELFAQCREYAHIYERFEETAVRPVGLRHGLKHKLEQSEAWFIAGKDRKAAKALCQFVVKVERLAGRQIESMQAERLACCAVEVAVALELELDCLRKARRSESGSFPCLEALRSIHDEFDPS